jgi:hypothetical protein
MKLWRTRFVDENGETRDEYTISETAPSDDAECLGEVLAVNELPPAASA